MALSSAQKLQFLRLPVVDASVTSGDKHAFLGLIVTATSAVTLTSAQKKQILRLPVIDASVTTSDKYAFLGLMESADAGALYELFETTWLIDPTWDAFENPQTNDGNVFAELGSFSFSWRGLYVSPPAVVPPNEGTAIENLNATTDVRTNVNMCDISGVRFFNDERMYKTWEGRIVKKHSFDEKHPQLDHVVKPTYEQRKYKRRNPEEEDIFLSTNEVTVDDL